MELTTRISENRESFSLEQPNHFFPFLSFLCSTPTSHSSLKPQLLPPSKAALRQYESDNVNAVFTPEGTIRQNETIALLDAAAVRSRLLKGKGQRQSLHMALAIRETSVIIEGMRGIWLERREEVIEDTSKECESWIDVGGKSACSIDEFWGVVGEEQRNEKSPVSLPKE